MAWAAYRAHSDDRDVDAFLAAYPEAKASRLDDCFLCHPGGKVEGKAKGSCDYCHASYGLKPPHGVLPLNDFGRDYLQAGRSAAAFARIAGLDSDGDGVANGEEIRQLTHPGEAGDRPGLAQPPSVRLSAERVRSLPAVEQFMLMNTTKQADFYASYRGVALWGLLQAVGLAPEAQSVSVFAPDGFATDFSLEELRQAVPNGRFYSGLPWVTYPAGLSYGDQERLPGELRIMLAYARDGQPLDPGRLAQAGNRWVLEGEGPYRLVVPQVVAGPPDRPSTAPDRNSPPYPFDEKADHNAGRSVRSVVAIRVNPLPPGTKDFNWHEGGWSLVDSGELVLYGALR
jgi:hypothetical protein